MACCWLSAAGTTGRENTINAVESLRLVGARIVGTVLNRVKAGPAYFYYPTYAANRVLLEGSGSVPAISAATPARALSAAPIAPEQPVVHDHPSAEHVPGGLVEPLLADLLAGSSSTPPPVDGYSGPDIERANSLPEDNRRSGGRCGRGHRARGAQRPVGNGR